MESDLYQTSIETSTDPAEVFETTFSQEGGNILGAVGKIGKLVSKHSGQVTKAMERASEISERVEQGMSKAEEMANRAQGMSDRAAGIRSQVNDITGQLGALTGSFDSNYSQNQLAVNSPLGSQGNFQTFGDFVCIKKSFLSDLRTLLFELLAKRDEV
jgi:methyl-accepting chemotaxis protein